MVSMNIVLAFPTMMILSWIAITTIAAVTLFMGGGDDDEDLTYNGPPTPP